MLRKLSLIILFLTINVLLSAQQYELNSIKFEGNKEISSSALRDVILSKETPWWFWKFLNSFTPLGSEAIYFDSLNIPVDLSALKSYYNANGFFETTFSDSIEVDSADEDVNLFYRINEGPPSNYQGLIIEGLKETDPVLANNIWIEMTLDTTERYSEENMQLEIDKAVSALQNNGYMFAKFDSTIIYKDTSNNKADIHIFLTTGKRYTIDTILVEKKGEGASFVDDNLLRDISGIKVGELYSLEKIRRSQVRLFRTGLFNSIILSEVETDTFDNRVPLRLTGNIGYLNELSPEIIVNNQQNAFNIGLGANYIRKNFFGYARKLTIGSSFGIQDLFNADLSNLIRKFSFRDTSLLGYVDARVKLEQPFLFGRPIFGTWENYATINKQRNYNLTVLGSKFTFEFELPRFTVVNFLSTYYSLEQTYEVYRTNNDSLSSKLISAIGADLGRTTADDILFPTRGYNISLQIEHANSLPYLFSKLSGKKYSGAIFYKLLFNSSVFGSFGRIRNHIFAMKFKIGHLQAYYGDYFGIPLNRTFYAGGSNSVRGWRSNELVPKNAPKVGGLLVKGVNVKGGTFILEGSFEYRRRFLNNFGFVFFTDYGNTWIGYKQFRFDEVALAVGTGFRYYSQIAPFRIDFGFKLYDPADKQYIFGKQVWKNFEFHFGIGEAF